MRYILKVDVDVKMTPQYFKLFLKTRIAILKALKLKVIKINWCETEKGYHFWFHVSSRDKLNDFDRCMIQFLLGDDHNRVRYNMLRVGFDVFSEFNCLFSGKFEEVVK